MKKILIVLVAMMFLFTAVQAMAESEFRISTPTGAPAIALSGIYAENPDAVNVIGTDKISEAFTIPEADFVVAPVNAGAKLYKAGKSTYRLAAVITWGNLVFAGRGEELTPEMISERKLVLFGNQTLNYSIAMFLLEKKGIVPAEIGDPLGDAAETQALLTNEEEAATIVLTAEPAATALKIKAKTSDITISTFPLNDLYKDVTGYDGFPQAGVFVKEETAAENPELVKTVLEKIKASAELCESNPEAVAKTVVEDMEILKAEAVVLKALPGCSIRYVDALEAKEQVEYAAQIDLAQFGGELPADDFYYEAK